MSQTTDGEHIRRKSPPATLRCSGRSKSPKRRSTSPRRRGGVNGAAAHWLILARSSGSESKLSAVRFSTYCFAEGITSGLRVLGTLPCDEQVTVETDQPLFELSNPGIDRTFQYTTFCRSAQIGCEPKASVIREDDGGGRCVNSESKTERHMGRCPCDFRHDYPAVIVQFETVQPSRTESVKPSSGCQGSAG